MPAFYGSKYSKHVFFFFVWIWYYVLQHIQALVLLSASLVHVLPCSLRIFSPATESGWCRRRAANDHRALHREIKKVSIRLNIKIAIMPMVIGSVILRKVSAMGALNKPCLSVARCSGLFFSSMFNVFLMDKRQGYKKAGRWASAHFSPKAIRSFN